MRNLFIIGSPRSGTTFLAGLLKPTIYGEPFETQFILKYNKKLKQYGNITHICNLTALVNDIKSERAIAQWGIDIDAIEIKENLGDNFSYVDVVDEICKTLMASKDKVLWGDKTPHYILELEALTKLYPEAKYLYIIRDGRDVALSLLRKVWGPNNVYSCALQWQEANNKSQFEIIKKLEQKGQLIVIRYETLIDEPESECERIYAFLGEDIAEHSAIVEQLTAKTIKGNHSKWKKNMSAVNTRVYECIAQETLSLHGYSVKYEPKELGVIEESYFRIHNKLVHFKHLFLMNFVDGIKIKYFGQKPFDGSPDKYK